MATFRTMAAMVMISAALRGPAAAVCVDDCDGSGAVAVNELITCVNVALGQATLAQCIACDGDGDGAVAIDELVSGVAVALGARACTASDTPTFFPSPTPTPTSAPDQLTTCCVAAYYVWACEQHTVAECATLKGVDMGDAPCGANPCGSIPPDTGHGICCLPNAGGTEIECEDRSATACAAAGGVVKAVGTVCTASTCADVAPPTTRCCVSKRSGSVVECEDVSPAACTDLGGTDIGPGTCSLDACAGR